MSKKINQNIMETLNESKNTKMMNEILKENTWAGVPGTTHRYHGDWSDPEIEAGMCLFSEWDAQEYLSDDERDFEQFIKDDPENAYYTLVELQPTGLADSFYDYVESASSVDELQKKLEDLLKADEKVCVIPREIIEHAIQMCKDCGEWDDEFERLSELVPELEEVVKDELLSGKYHWSNKPIEESCSSKKKLTEEKAFTNIEDAILDAVENVCKEWKVDYERYTNLEMNEAVKYKTEDGSFVVTVDELLDESVSNKGLTDYLNYKNLDSSDIDMKNNKITFKTAKATEEDDGYLCATVDFLNNIEEYFKDNGIKITTTGEGNSASDGKTFTIDFSKEELNESAKPQIVVTNIKWDTDGDKSVKLPKKVIVDPEVVDIDLENYDKDELDETLGDYLSDKYGYCHFGFNYEIDNPKGKKLKESEDIKEVKEYWVDLDKTNDDTGVVESRTIAKFDTEDEARAFAMSQAPRVADSLQDPGVGNIWEYTIRKVYSEDEWDDWDTVFIKGTHAWEAGPNGDEETNWAAEEEADATERFENRYMGGGNGSTFNESKKSIPTMEELAKEIQAEFDSNEYGNHYDIIWDEPNKWIGAQIDWGDWKHDHLYFDHVVETVLNKHNLDYTYDTITTEENGSDCFSAWHQFEIQDGSLNESKEDELHPRTVMGFDEKDMWEWKAIARAFCKKIGAKLLFVNSYSFGYEDKDGQLVHMYVDELYDYLQNHDLNEGLSPKSGRKTLPNGTYVMNYNGTYIVLNKHGANIKEFDNEEDATKFAEEFDKKTKGEGLKEAADDYYEIHVNPDLEKYLYISLEDDDFSSYGGVGHADETVEEFIGEAGIEDELNTPNDLDGSLISCGIKPVCNPNPDVEIFGNGIMYWTGEYKDIDKNLLLDLLDQADLNEIDELEIKIAE